MASGRKRKSENPPSARRSTRSRESINQRFSPKRDDDEIAEAQPSTTVQSTEEHLGAAVDNDTAEDVSMVDGVKEPVAAQVSTNDRSAQLSERKQELAAIALADPTRASEWEETAARDLVALTMIRADKAKTAAMERAQSTYHSSMAKDSEALMHPKKQNELAIEYLEKYKATERRFEVEYATVAFDAEKLYKNWILLNEKIYAGFTADDPEPARNPPSNATSKDGSNLLPVPGPELGDHSGMRVDNDGEVDDDGHVDDDGEVDDDSDVGPYGIKIDKDGNSHPPF